MVLRCAWGTCNGDERYPDRLQGGTLVLFPKPKTQREKCLRWIKACGRPHSQLNITNINKHKAVCSKHFVGGCGPTAEYPDPIKADGTEPRPCRNPPTKRHRSDESSKRQTSECEFQSPNPPNHVQQQETHLISELKSDCSTQTEEEYVNSLQFLAVVAENHKLKAEVQEKNDSIESLKKQLQKLESEKNLQENLKFNVANINKRNDIKDLFFYYTSLNYVTFCSLLSFLCPADFKIDYKSGDKRSDLLQMLNENCLFLVLCRLRHNFGLKDVALRFNLSLQSAGIVFNTWINHMYFKFGQLPIWPHRDVVIEKMPQDFKASFPNCLVIIDATEIKTEQPSGLALQSQMYSEYKSSTTFKCLLGCDPNGALMYVSELFTGSISDKVLTQESGFYKTLEQMKLHGYVLEGDSIMADKGFTISDELDKLGLKLNIPPFCKTGCQMSPSDTNITSKIAKHRIHIERLIARIKKFQFIANKIPAKSFQNINQIWTVCCFMTLFQEGYLK